MKEKILNNKLWEKKNEHLERIKSEKKKEEE